MFVIKRMKKVAIGFGLALLLMPGAMAMAQAMGNPHAGFHSKKINGPWELLVQKGMQGQALAFPIEVADESKAEKLNKVIPLLGTPIKIKMKEFWPNLQRDEVIKTQANAGAIVNMRIVGANIDKQMYLLTDDPTRRTISSTIGRIELVKLNGPDGVDETLTLLAKNDAVGILTVQMVNEDQVTGKVSFKYHDYVISKGSAVTLPDGAKATIEEYFPHFTRDNETKTEINQSDRPVNPAVKVKVVRDGKETESWLWSKFPTFGIDGGHPGGMGGMMAGMENGLMSFRQIPVRDEVPCFALFVGQKKNGMIYTSGDETTVKPLVYGEKYPLNEEYSFVVDGTHYAATLKDVLSNASDELKSPAIVVDYQVGKHVEEKILQLGGRPTHIKGSDGDMIVLRMRRKQDGQESKMPMPMPMPPMSSGHVEK